MNYWIKGPDEDQFKGVTRDEYVAAERRGGFVNTLGKPDEPATAAFTAADGTRGTTIECKGSPIHLGAETVVPVNGFDPNHHFYDQRGEPISLEQWAALRELGIVLRESAVSEKTTLKTVYLGFVDPLIADARLFGSALITGGNVFQIELYDSEERALIRHFAHEEAIAAGQHCALCKEGRTHSD